jgi:glucan 1,3-beta-glucosidase
LQTIRLFFFSVALTLPWCDPAFAAASLPVIAASGSRLVDPNGSTIILKGCNLGNYLMLESWMFGGTLGVEPHHSFPDGAFVYQTLRERFGEDKCDHLITLFRDGWITPRDMELIKSFGFNVVRLPFDYRLVQEDRAPFAVKADAFYWLDHAVDMAEDAGVYVILDLHGTPGGQSLEGHTGQAGQDKLWNSEEDQRRTVEVWRAVADHFKNRSAVAAYDLINEPYGNHKEDCRPVLARLMPSIYQAIRSTGDRHVVFFSGALNGGIAFYGNPHSRGMTNVGFTEHYYPGMFGSKAALETQARVVTQELPAKREYADEIASPYYVGEFNVVLDSENPERVMRAYYDRFAEYNWPCTMWSYKLVGAKGGLGPDAWFMVTNAGPSPSLDLDNSSYEDFEKFFTGLATMPLATNERLRDALTAPNPEPLYLTRYPPLPTRPPADPPISEPVGYSSIDLGSATPGYTRVLEDGNIMIMGGGSDIFGATDSCRYVAHLENSGRSDVRATIISFVDSAEYAKAGVMARWGEGDRPDSAMAMVNIFPDGTVALISRRRAGGGAIEKKVAACIELPVELRLQISAGRAVGMYRNNRGDWKMIASAAVPDDPSLRTGIAVCAHGDAVLTTVKARLGPTADDAVPAPGEEGNNLVSGPSLLANGSFEEQGNRNDLAAHWNRWGPWMNREAAWHPTHSGSAEIGYHHWQISSEDTSGWWQDVGVAAGKRYAFSIYAQRDIPARGQTEARTLELRMESVTDDGEVTLNSQTFDISKLATGKEWTRVRVSGTADGPRMRVLLVISPAAGGPRGGAVKLDDAALVDAQDMK